MKNRYLDNFDNIVKIKVEGRNINNFIKKIIKKKINIIKLIPISYKEVQIILKYNDYKNIVKMKTIYKVSIINSYGKLKIKKIIKNNLILYISIIIGLILIIILSNIIFSIDIIHEDKTIRNLIKEELSKNGIKKYHFKKKYYELEKIEDIILNNNKDKLEWIEIKENGTKYIVRIEERKITKKEDINQYQNIISKKDAIITEINAIKGEKIKQINNYVRKGEVIISGLITLPNNTKIPSTAIGDVYGEVWYKINLNYPYIYQEEILTGKRKTIYVLDFFNHRISFLNFNKYKSFKSKDKILLSNNLYMINLIKEIQYELIVKDEVYPEDIAINKAKDYIIKKLKKDNPDIKTIKKIIVVSSQEKEKTIELKLFVSTIEKISQISKIDPNYIENQE